jgi:predicted HTH domain antitoxin
MMALIIDISPENEKLLQAEWGDLNQAAREALIIESYRQSKLSIGQCSQILGKNLFETEAFFRSRHVELPLTKEDIEQDKTCLERILK